MNLGNLLFSFAGRINRSKFWLGYILSVVFVGVALLAVGLMIPWDQIFVMGPDGQPVLDADGNPEINPEAPSVVIPAIVMGITALVTLIMNFALMVKRCHDRGKSGWWSLVSLIPMVGFVWVIVDLGVMEGDEGPNQWGPNPLGNHIST